MKQITNKVIWKDSIGNSTKKHYVSIQKCPSCGIHETPQPISQKVWEQYPMHKYECDGCNAFKDHLV